MRHALSLGRRGQGRVWPNPAVGCVIVNDGRIVGRGWTQPGGRPHAETVALAQAGDRAKGATAYVTLEPCVHHGQTPPCTQALIAAQVACVVSALQDDDPRVNGKGFQQLAAAGIEVVTGVCADTAAQDHAGFFLRLNEQRPFVTLKLASSFDGRIATVTGDSQWITGPQARRAVHALRLSHDAVMVGGATVRADDPSLTVRDLGAVAQPTRIVVGQAARVPADAQLVRTARQTPTWVLHQDDFAPMADTGVMSCRYTGDLRAAMAVLAQKGITRVFCEGGGSLAASLLAEGLVDELIGFTAGAVIGSDGLPSLATMGVAALSDAPRFALVDTQVVGGDVMHRWRRS
ncbi:bifunctional diaminohydroxyphosphoribosylaminopyrimidine deaminase/5-amino-6-(5-phosphoribosylamino)uracil reductase RibD [Nereida sp. MMG025]|uniref:bifunctional diaminohydroxyphosphoribosylaminopyrimidine deaminase/5-amino-6-(5-phosphoribosylamino)uracil reductase RibD n=1 Tax=Nereida sp. MMG025 TaxID=2909981 RepID=UPI001EFF8AB0|nr:bifunctional diaminohydroxyphosphoribosylaminopyrimidine deaminase/5-amino-6-(5-phosphoribosylamino)uracil reductase RibD [Nereida sp. MMG025]